MTDLFLDLNKPSSPAWHSVATDEAVAEIERAIGAHLDLVRLIAVEKALRRFEREVAWHANPATAIGEWG